MFKGVMHEDIWIKRLALFGAAIPRRRLQEAQRSLPDHKYLPCDTYGILPRIPS